MLTSEMAINFRRGNKIFPLLLQTDDEKYLRDAANLIGIFEAFQGKKRGELEEERITGFCAVL
jgi:predicted nuclease of restriction endonuclease-like RecB superfamily